MSKNQWVIAKEIQRHFWYTFNLLITREQAMEVMGAMKNQSAMYKLNGHYISTRDRDDIRYAYPGGVKYGGYQVHYNPREWNDAVMAGKFCEANKINNPHTVEYDPEYFEWGHPDADK